MSSDMAINKKAVDLEAIIDEYPAIKKDLETTIYSNFESNGHKIGGYAFFTQFDPRSYDNEFKDYILLLQIDSDDQIMWGDVGAGNLFIHPANLAKKDFSRVLIVIIIPYTFT